MKKISREKLLVQIQQGAYIDIENLHHLNLHDDKSLALLILDRQSLSLAFLSDRLKNDRDIVIKAVSGNGSSLCHASEDLKKDKEIVNLAVSNHYSALKYADDIYKKDSNFILKIFKNKKDSDILTHVDSSLLDDIDFAIQCCQISHFSINNFSEHIQNNEKVLLVYEEKLKSISKKAFNHYLNSSFYSDFYNEKMEILKKYKEAIHIGKILENNPDSKIFRLKKF
jgi:hypothetical protein